MNILGILLFIVIPHLLLQSCGAIDKASESSHNRVFQRKVFTDYTWRNAATKTVTRLIKRYYQQYEA